jgi:hypothetical protein
VPESPLSFFVSVLDDRTYVRQRARGGVSVFPFRVAAGTPFPYHFILDASPEKATVSYRRLSFLRPDKRAELDASDIDASAAFFRAYQSCPLIGAARATPGLAAPGAVFSFADHAFTGWRSMHGHFTETAPSALPLADPLGAELAFLAGSGEGTAPFPDRLYPSQRDGFASFARRDGATESAPFVFLDAPFAPGATGPDLIAELRDAIARDRIEDGLARTSQSDLKDYAICPARWFLARSLRLEVADADAELLNERNLGLLYHEVLRRVYERVAAEDKAFDPRARGRVLRVGGRVRRRRDGRARRVPRTSRETDHRRPRGEGRGRREPRHPGGRRALPPFRPRARRGPAFRRRGQGSLLRDRRPDLVRRQRERRHRRLQERARAEGE